MRLKCALVVALVSALTASAAQADVTKGELRGKPDLKSAGPLAFGPRGVLFIGDPKGAAIFAVDTKDAGPEHGARVKASINVDNIKQTIASLLGTNPEQVRIQDVAVNPASGKVYLSVSRGRGPDAARFDPCRGGWQSRRVRARPRGLYQGCPAQPAQGPGFRHGPPPAE